MQLEDKTLETLKEITKKEQPDDLLLYKAYSETWHLIGKQTNYSVVNLFYDLIHVQREFLKRKSLTNRLFGTIDEEVRKYWMFIQGYCKRLVEEEETRRRFESDK